MCALLGQVGKEISCNDVFFYCVQVKIKLVKKLKEQIIYYIQIWDKCASINHVNKDYTNVLNISFILYKFWEGSAELSSGEFFNILWKSFYWRNGGLSWLWSYGCWIYNYLCNQCLSSITLWVRTPLRRCVLATTLCDKFCQWFATGRWFSPGTPVSSTNKTDRHDITEILLKVALNTINHKPEENLVQHTTFCLQMSP